MYMHVKLGITMVIFVPILNPQSYNFLLLPYNLLDSGCRVIVTVKNEPLRASVYASPKAADTSEILPMHSERGLDGSDQTV